MKKTIGLILVSIVCVLASSMSPVWAGKNISTLNSSTFTNDNMLYEPLNYLTRTITSFPYVQTFDAFPDGITPVQIAEEWYNGAGDDGEWTVISGPTPMGDTGPSSDHTSGSGKYLYTESLNNPGFPEKSAFLLSPLFDMVALSGPKLTFWYHMYGMDMGELHVDVYAGGTWIYDIIPCLSGDKGDQWYQHDVDLSVYAGTTVRVRFRGITGSGFWSDMAIDDVSVYDGTVPGLPTNPAPPDEATGVPVDQDLSWINRPDTETVDLYFDDNEILVTEKDPTVKVVDNELVSTYNPGVLDLDSDYFWRVVLHNTNSVTTDGPVWSFRTTDHYALCLSKGTGEHISDVAFSWLPETMASLFYKQSPHILAGYQILAPDVFPTNAWHDAGLVDGIDYFYIVTNAEAPIIQSISDVDICLQNGVTIQFSGAAGAPLHELWVDGVETLTDITSPCFYNPSDKLDHDFVVRAIQGDWNFDSNRVTYADVNNTPIPTITGPNVNICPDETVTLMTESGMSNYQWYDDASPLPGVTTDTHVITASGDYTVSYVNTFGCSGFSTNYSVTITTCCTNGALFTVDAIVGNMRSVCPGTFTQGSPTDEPCRVSDEAQFNHTLNRTLAVMETEISRQMWADLLSVQVSLPVDPSYTDYAPTMSHPVNRVTWYYAVLFANLLSLQNGLTRCYYTDASFTVPLDSTNFMTGPFYCDFDASGYRLLTEGEWEYVARAGTTTPFSCNETNYTSGTCASCTTGTHPTLELYAVYCANYPPSHSAPVGSKLSNPWNVMGLHGNVWEWCWDWYGPYSGDKTDDTGPEDGTERVLRSGDWQNEAWYCRSAARLYVQPGYPWHSFGFRLARSIALSSNPVITSISDNDPCAQSGISISFDRGFGATQHDLWVDGVETLTDITSPCFYNPGNTLGHDYVVRAFQGGLYFDSNLVPHADVNNTPGAPVDTSVTDIDGCAAGVNIVFTPGEGATSHDLYVDGSLQVSSIVSPHIYVPGDSNSHNYVVRSINGTCWINSETMAEADVDNTPTPTITGLNTNTCPVETVTLTTESGMSNYQWYGNDSPLPGETAHTLVVTTSGHYTVSYVNTFGCSGLSSAHAVTIKCCNSGDIYSADAIIGNMRIVCPETFIQGSPTDEPGRASDETQFNHTITRTLAVMETEVTRQMWADLQLVQATLPVDPSYTPDSTMSHPVHRLTWFEAVLFANLLSLQNGLTRCYYTNATFTVPLDATNYLTGPFYCNFAASGYRLLTEGEWEYAARAGTTTPFSCNEPNYTTENCTSCTAGTHPVLEQYAVYCANDNNWSEPVGSKLSNPWNLKDMHGNVWEWCWDWHNSVYPGNSTDYSGPGVGSNRVGRGGVWDYMALHCRSAYRYYLPPGERSFHFGFRLGRTVN